MDHGKKFSKVGSSLNLQYKMIVELTFEKFSQGSATSVDVKNEDEGEDMFSEM